MYLIHNWGVLLQNATEAIFMMDRLRHSNDHHGLRKHLTNYRFYLFQGRTWVNMHENRATISLFCDSCFVVLEDICHGVLWCLSTNKICQIHYLPYFLLIITTYPVIFANCHFILQCSSYCYSVTRLKILCSWKKPTHWNSKKPKQIDVKPSCPIIYECKFIKCNRFENTSH